MLINNRYIQILKTNIFKRNVFKIFTYRTFSKLFYCQNYCTNSLNIFNKIDFDYEYLCDKTNTDAIRDNIVRRKSNGDIDKVTSLWNDLKHKNYSPSEKQNVERQLLIESLKIPNKSSLHLYEYGENPHLIEQYNEKPTFKFKVKEFHNLVEYLNLLICDGHLHGTAGAKAYVFSTSLANLERALIRYSVDFLLKKGFTLISVPDLVECDIIERCGQQTNGIVSQVFHLNNFENKNICLSGTAEMAIGGFLQDRELDIKDLPLKIAAVSRCYRQEEGRGSLEKGIFRVQQFTKVEMFGVTANESGEESSNLYKELIKLQTELFAALDIHFQVLDMPICDLGDPAYTKTDIEAWIPVQRIYGEISSASNCLDYQSRRLNLRYKNSKGDFKFAHTVNGTASAIPRVLISMIASKQAMNKDTKKATSFDVPKALQPYIGVDTIGRDNSHLQIYHFPERLYTGSIIKSMEELEIDSA